MVVNEFIQAEACGGGWTRDVLHGLGVERGPRRGRLVERLEQRKSRRAELAPQWGEPPVRIARQHALDPPGGA
jgi:hypothetical protein